MAAAGGDGYKQLTGAASEELSTGAGDSELLSYCTGTSSEVTLEGVKLALQKAGSAAGARVVALRETEEQGLMREGDSAISVILRRALLDERYAIRLEEVPEMIRCISASDPGAVFAVSRFADFQYAVKALTPSHADLTSEMYQMTMPEIPREQFRSQGSGATIARGDKVVFFSPGDFETALHVLFAEDRNQAISSKLTEQILDVLLSAIKATDPATTAFDGFSVDGPVPRYGGCPSPLSRLCQSPKLSMPLLEKLLSAFPLAARSVTNHGESPLHMLLANPKSTHETIALLMRRAGPLTLPPRPPTYYNYRVASVARDRADLIEQAQWGGSKVGIKNVPTSRLRLLYAPVHYPQPETITKGTVCANAR